MVALKVEQQADGVVLAASEEALTLLGASPGDVFFIARDEHGKLTLSKQPSQEERFERGKAFLGRYRATFDALAK